MDRSSIVLGWILAACAVLIIWLAHYSIYTEQFTPDSWYVFQLSKSVFYDFFRTNSYRNYMIDTPYSRSFPPLFPILIATVNSTFDAGIFAGIYLNIAIVCLMLAGLLQYSKRITNSRITGFIVFLCVMSSAPFIDEFQSARLIPLSLLLLI